MHDAQMLSLCPFARALMRRYIRATYYYYYYYYYYSTGQLFGDTRLYSAFL